jgi:hypothetical protein
MQRRTLKRIIFGWLSLIVIVALLGKVSIAAPNSGGITIISTTEANFSLIKVDDQAGGIGLTYTAVSEGSTVTH